MKLSKNKSGQALLIVVLVMAVMLTVTLSVVSRSITDVSVSTREGESLRAFSAAEAGIEEVLVQNLGVGQSVSDTVETGEIPVTYDVTVTGFPESTNEYNYPQEVAIGDVATVWFMDHDADGNLICPSCFTGPQAELCWGKTVASQTPAVEVSLIYEQGGTYHVARKVYDPSSGRTPGSISPTGGTCSIGDIEYQYSQRLRFNPDFGFNPTSSDPLVMMRVRFLYNSDTTQILGVQTIGGNLPQQGKRIESLGSSGDQARKVEVYELYPSLPTIFDSAVFSRGGGLTK